MPKIRQLRNATPNTSHKTENYCMIFDCDVINTLFMTSSIHCSLLWPWFTIVLEKLKSSIV